MADCGYVSESEGSIADQYDIIDPDDLSEISNDDHDTASITSNEHEQDGQLTPERLESGSEDDGLEEDVVSASRDIAQVAVDSLVDIRSHSSTESVVMIESLAARQTKAENELIDSYMSDDLETPRQSTMPFPPAGPAARQRIPNVLVECAQDPYRVLFVSDRNEPREDMDLIVLRVTAAMAAGIPDGASTPNCRIVRLPPTPAQITNASATVVCGQDGISATVQHCVGSTRQSFGSHALAILDHEGEHASWFVVGSHGQTDQHRPDLAIFHLRDIGDEHKLEGVLEVVDAMKVPSVIIFESEKRSYNNFRHSGSTKFKISGADFIAMDRPTLTKAVGKIVAKSRCTKRQAEGSASASRLSHSLGWTLRVLPVFFLLIFTYLSYIPSTFDVSARREGLLMSMAQVPDLAATTNITNAIDLEHLLPALPAFCYTKTFFGQVQRREAPECKVKPRYQAVQPNHILMSLPGTMQFPQVVSTNVQKSDGRRVSFNRTQLIEGVSMITIDPNETYDTVTINMLTEGPHDNVTASHCYGKRFLQRKTYEHAGTEVSKKVGSDLAIMSKTVHKINDLLSTEVTASVQATMNFTSSLTKYMTRELQVVSRELQLMRKAASSIFHKGPSVKDLTVVQKDLVKFAHGLTGSVKSTMAVAKSSTKALVKMPLVLSRERLHGFKRVLQKTKSEDRQTAQTVKNVAFKGAQKGAGNMKNGESKLKKAELKFKEAKLRAMQKSQLESDHRLKLKGCQRAENTRKPEDVPSGIAAVPGANQRR